jgi:hypothetical protein
LGAIMLPVVALMTGDWMLAAVVAFAVLAASTIATVVALPAALAAASEGSRLRRRAPGHRDPGPVVDRDLSACGRRASHVTTFLAVQGGARYTGVRDLTSAIRTYRAHPVRLDQTSAWTKHPTKSSRRPTAKQLQLRATSRRRMGTKGPWRQGQRRQEFFVRRSAQRVRNSNERHERMTVATAPVSVQDS